MLKAALINDTSVESHHGCNVVERVITRELAERGIVVAVRVPVRSKWWRSPHRLRQIARCDVIIVNGEGTLHSGKAAAQRVLQITESPELRDVPKVLINTIWQDNPVEWRRYLTQFEFIAVRSRNSALEIAAAIGKDVAICLDLSLSIHATAMPRRKSEAIAFGDSVLPEVSSALGSAFEIHDGPKFQIPITMHRPDIRGVYAIGGAPLTMAASLSPYLTSLRHPQLRRTNSLETFLSHLAGSKLYVTGRFHGAALALALGVPFLAVKSNTTKIEDLVADVGLRADRIIATRAIADLNLQDWDYSASELSARQAALAEFYSAKRQIFDKIASIAETSKSARRAARYTRAGVQ